MRLRQTVTGPGMCQCVACAQRLARSYIVNVQALSIHADDNFMSLSFLQATIAEHWRRIDATVFRIQWFGKRCNCIGRLHGCHIGGRIAVSFYMYF